MTNIVDNILAQVCLDERVSDGVFRMDEEQHMDALRDHLISRGLTKEDAVAITNKMLEGKYPERQAYRKEDGILVTWPSTKHKQKAMAKNPGKYVDENPFPKQSGDKETEEPKTPPSPPPSIEPKEDPNPSPVRQGGQLLAIEPIKGPDTSDPLPEPPTSPVKLPSTPEEKEAQKAVVKQMIKTDDSALTTDNPPVSENDGDDNMKRLQKVVIYVVNNLSYNQLKELYDFIASKYLP